MSDETCMKTFLDSFPPSLLEADIVQTLTIFFTAVSGSLSLSASDFGVKAAADLAFSQDRTATAASSAQSQQSGSISISTAKCLTTNIELRPDLATPPFHPSFQAALIAALDDANVAAKMLEVIQNYGTHYYVRASIRP